MTIPPPDVRKAKDLVRAFNRERRAKAPKTKRPQADRQNRERNPVFLAWLRRQRCAAAHIGGCSGAIEAAHVRFSDARAGRTNPGLQRKPDDRYAVPLCAGHHREGPQAQHRGGERTWWDAIGVDVADLMRRLFAAFEDGKDQP